MSAVPKTVYGRYACIFFLDHGDDTMKQELQQQGKHMKCKTENANKIFHYANELILHFEDEANNDYKAQNFRNQKLLKLGDVELSLGSKHLTLNYIIIANLLKLKSYNGQL